MRKLIPLLLLLAAPSLAEKEAFSLDSMSWLAGTWEGNMWGGTYSAHYTTSAGGKILSFSELRRDGKVVSYEFEVFARRGDDTYFTPYPGGKKKESFKLAESELRKAVFDHSKKDFPTRVTYHRVADDNLVITLSDPHGTSGKTMKFDLKKK